MTLKWGIGLSRELFLLLRLWDEKCHLWEQNEALNDTSKKSHVVFEWPLTSCLSGKLRSTFTGCPTDFNCKTFSLAIQDALNDRCLRYVIYIFFAITNLIHFFFFVSDVLSKIEIMAMADEKKPTIVRQGWLQKRGKLLSSLLLLLCFNQALNEATVLNRSCQSWQMWIFLFCNLFKLRS